MLKLGQLDLQFTLSSAGALSENIEDERGAIKNLAAENPLEIAALGGRKLVVEDNGIDIGSPAMEGKLIRLSFTNESRRARRHQFLDAISHNFAACRGC